MNTPAVAERYSRQALLRELGEAGQQAIEKTRCLIIGAGGLGCPAALALVEAGIGHLTIVDADVVEVSNLPRQILHTPDRVGMNKALSAKTALHAVNPEVPVDAVQAWADDRLLADLMHECDIVLDCTDNFKTRHAINRIARYQRKLLVTSSVVRFSGQICVFDFRAGPSPCYACLFPEDEETDIKASATGVFTPAVGMIGMMAACEALKACTGLPTLTNRFVLIDTLNMRFEELRVAQDPGCPVCSARYSGNRPQ